MKKIILLLLILCCLINTLTLNISATEELDPDDSRNIPDEVLELFADKDAGMITKIYVAPIALSFEKYAAIEEILQSIAHTNILYIQDKGDDVEVYVTYRDLEGYWPTDQPIYRTVDFWDEMKTGEAIRAVSKDIVIESVYFLHEVDPYSSSAIYYRTNLGDYVYFNGYGSDERLFSAEVFWAYMKAARMVWQETKKEGPVIMGSWPNYDICDLSAYDFRSPNFDPDQPLPEIEMPKPEPKAEDYLWILGVAVLVAAGLGIWAVRKRKPTDGIDDIPVDGQMDAKE